MNYRSAIRLSPDTVRLRLCHPVCAMVVVLLCFLSAYSLDAQIPPSNQPSHTEPGTTPAAGVESLTLPGFNDPNSSTNAINVRRNSGLEEDDRTMPGVTMTLPASEIIAMLEQRPEVNVELKALAAVQLQQQGAQVNANEITDEELYAQIERKPEFRARVTTFLLARGYVTEQTIRASGSRESNGNDQGLYLDEEAVSGRPSRSAARDGIFDRDTVTSTDPAGPSTQDKLALLSAGSFPAGPFGSGAPIQSEGSSPLATGRRTNDDSQRSEGKPSHSSTDEPNVLRVPAPYNLRSLRDLYTQVPGEDPPLKRFGSEVFVSYARGPSSQTLGRESPIDVPLGPDYIVGAGDALTISLWGGVTQNLTRTVDHDGRILLPEGGSVDVSGMPLGQVQDKIGSLMKQQFRNAQISVTVSQLRTVRVYVVGDVQRPGGYDITSVATPIGALTAAGGPTAAGSLRTLRHLRGAKLLEEVDLYSFLLHGLRTPSIRFESGDTLLVPPAGPQVAISGAVRRPAIYELSLSSNKTSTTLGDLLDDAGGLMVAASPSHITVERISANQQRVTTTIDLEQRTAAAQHDAFAGFTVADGDRIHVGAILPYSQRVIYLEGHVSRPGRQAYRDGMRLSDVLKSYRDLLPEPSDHGELVRLVAPDLHAEIIPFDLREVLIGNSNQNLQPFDTIRILGRYEADAPRVTIHGEVLRPGVFPLSAGMTAAQLVRMAGGFRRGALLENADLTSFTVTGKDEVVGALKTIRIGAVIDGSEPGADVVLHAGDILTIHQIPGWSEIGQAVTIEGQVMYPGSYGFKEGERLSSVLRRAGGLRSTAYPEGAVMVREQVRELEEKSRQELIRQIETSSAAARLAPSLGPGDSGQTLQLIQAQQEQVLSRLKSEPASGRLVVHISADVDSWANTAADIELRRGDVLTIPKRPGFVLVTGQVYNATALTFSPGKTAGWYLQHAGGSNDTANRKEIFVIRANGSIIGRHSGGFFEEKVLSIKLDAGDVVVVPQKVLGASLFWRNLLTTAQLASSIAITAAVAGL